MLKDPAEQVTIILAAREQDVDDATTVVGMAVKLLQHILFDRMEDKKEPLPILLLLDETRRIRGFAPDEYITFARQARAGCVIVYQSLDQIGDDKKIRVILENVGTQIYLGSLVGETARHFIRLLPMRRQPSYSLSMSQSLAQGEVSMATQTGYQSVEYLSAADLYRLPAGRWPALVYINSQPRRDPILVDMDERISI
jgi:type IV secretory pathway TraG/TraD family ATPase VirD4